MNGKNKKIKNDIDNKQIVKEDYRKKITYSQSKSEPVDLLEIIELHLCRACIKL